MNRKLRLSNSSDFQRVRRSGKAYTHPLVVLIADHTGQPTSRFAVAAGKAFGLATRRNRAKRLLREAVRRSLPKVGPGWDVVLIARQPILDAQTTSVLEAVQSLLKRAGMIGEYDDIR